MYILGGNNLKKQRKYPPAVRGFQVFATVLFSLMLLFVTLSIVTSKRSLQNLCDKYVRAVEINEEYFSNFIDAGFSEQQVRDFLTDDRIYQIMSVVMSDRMLAIFHYTDRYDYTIDDCKDKISSILKEYNDTYDIGLTAGKLKSLTTYTLDISGLSSMFIYDTPLAYRNALFKTNELEDIRIDTRILKGIAALSAWYFGLSIGIMFLIVIGIIIFIHQKKIYPVIADTVFYPSLLFLALSIGEKVALPEEPLVTDHVFSYLGFVSLFGVIVGVIFYVIGYNLDKRRKINN